MRKFKISKIADRIIIGGFAFVILTSLIINIYLTVVEERGIDFSTIIVTIVFLVVYLMSEKLYKQKFNNIPEVYYYVTMIFAFFAVYLGSYLNFYERFGWWDVILHFTSGILIGLVSIITVSYFVTIKFGKYTKKSDILFLVIVGLLASISVAVFWEFYEYLYDYLFDGNMQRGIVIENADKFEIERYVRKSGRFIDIGLQDTMQDMFLAVLGAIVAGLYSYFHFAAIQLNKE
jgi:hypothetical protein